MRWKRYSFQTMEGKSFFPTLTASFRGFCVLEQRHKKKRSKVAEKSAGLRFNPRSRLVNSRILRWVRQQLAETWHPAKCKAELIRTGPTSHTHQSVSVFTLNKQTRGEKEKTREHRDNAARATEEWAEREGERVGKKTARITQEWRRGDRENDRQRSSERRRERYRQREMETMRGETKQVAWVIAWGI